MASEWLQLDSTDDWVRHDSEIVSSVKFLFYIVMGYTKLNLLHRHCVRKLPTHHISMFRQLFYPHPGIDRMWRHMLAQSMNVSKVRRI